jgi:predicted metal-dependent phosphoesterase TrpH
MAAEDAVRLIQDTGGISALAHPWSLKDPLSVVKRLKGVGLHAIEVYRGSGKASGMYLDLFLHFIDKQLFVLIML